jgi:hypothetical protein
MPQKKIYGDAAPSPGALQVPSLPTTKAASPPIQTDRFFRNGKHPDASAFNQMNEQMNQAMCFRTKEAFSIIGDLGSAPGIQASSTSGTRPRWRGAFHTGPYSHALLAAVVMFPPSSNFGNDTYATLKIYTGADETGLVSTTEFHYGPGPSNAAVGGWQYHKPIIKMLDGLNADTDYYLVFSDENFGLLQSACLADLQSMTENYNGYLPVNFTEQSQVLDGYRQNLVTPIPSLCKRGAAKVLGWTTNIQSSPQANATSTFRNVLDATSTTPSASTPGWTLDMRYKKRLSQTTVPCVLKVCGSWLNGGSASGGEVQLVDSSNTVIATVGGGTGWNSTTPKWLSVNVNMPALLDKYDLQFRISGPGVATGTVSLYAAVLYEYET